MNQRPLREIVTDVVRTATAESNTELTEDELVDRVLADPDMKIIMDGYDMHDRSEGLPEVIVRDIRHMISDVQGKS